MFTAAVTVTLTQSLYTIQEGAFATLYVSYEGTIHEGSTVSISIDAIVDSNATSKYTAIFIINSEIITP